MARLVDVEAVRGRELTGEGLQRHDSAQRGEIEHLAGTPGEVVAAALRPASRLEHHLERLRSGPGVPAIPTILHTAASLASVRGRTRAAREGCAITADPHPRDDDRSGFAAQHGFMTTLTVHPAPTGRARSTGVDGSTTRRVCATIAAVTRAALLASACPDLDEAGVLRTASANLRQARGRT